jgi:hypothetical protein
MRGGGAVYEVSIDVGDWDAAAALRAELRRRGFEVEELDGRPQVTVELLGFRPEQRIEEVLSATEDWLRGSDLRGVGVSVDGTSYRLHRPTG